MIPPVATVGYTPEALESIEALQPSIRRRVRNILTRLEDWPEVSGAKPLRGELQGHYRIRTGAYRVVFLPSPDGTAVTVKLVGNRKGVYD